MKYLIATDIHGSGTAVDLIKQKFEQIKADKLILLGDLLYHGSRNELTENYSPKHCTEVFNSLADKVIAVRGNCDSEVDQMVLNFQIYENAFVDIAGKGVMLTHGHHFNPDSPAKLSKGSVCLYGHFHKTRLTEVDGVAYINLASISIPKPDNAKSYGVLDESGIVIYDIDDKEILKFKF